MYMIALTTVSTTSRWCTRLLNLDISISEHISISELKFLNIQFHDTYSFSLSYSVIHYELVDVRNL